MGKIPSDSIVIFRDGNRQNVSIDNLLLIKKSVNAVLNHSGLAVYNGESKDTTVKIAELKLEISRAQKKRRGG